MLGESFIKISTHTDDILKILATMDSQQILIAIVVILVNLHDSYAASPLQPLCLDTNNLALRFYEPYSNKSLEQNSSGMATEMFKVALQYCCRGSVEFQHGIIFEQQNEAAEITINETIDFIMPIQVDVNQKKYLQNPFIPIIDSPGFAFYIIPNPSAWDAIVKAITSTWPLIVLMFMMVAISGTLFCLIETIGTRKVFKENIWEGIWWAFVSMTTVGYGDICPKTKWGKLFSIAWVLTGVASCALFTSYITTILTSACLSTKANVNGMKIGVIDGSEEHKYAMKKNARATGFRTVEEILEAFEQENIEGALIDSYVAASYHDELHRYRLQEIIEHVTSYGVVFQYRGLRFTSCIRDYLLSRQAEVFTLISENVQSIQVDILSTAEEKSRNLIDPSSPTFLVFITAMVLVLLITLSVGTIWEKKRLKEKDKKEGQNMCQGDKDELLTLTEWRQQYKTTLNETVQDIQNDAELIREKCENLANKLATQNGLVTLKSNYDQFNGNMTSFSTV